MAFSKILPAQLVQQAIASILGRPVQATSDLAPPQVLTEAQLRVILNDSAARTNHIPNPNCAVDTEGWIPYSNWSSGGSYSSGTVVPPADTIYTGTASCPSKARETSLGSRGPTALDIGFAAGNTFPGIGIYTDFTISRADTQANLWVTFDFQWPSGSYSAYDFDIGVYVRDLNFLTTHFIGNLPTPRRSGRFQGMPFPTTLGQQYRLFLCWNRLTGTAPSSLNLRIGGVSVAPSKAVATYAGSDTQVGQWTPTWSNVNATISYSAGEWRRNGDCAECQVITTFSSAGSGSNPIELNMPANLPIDMAKVASYQSCGIFGTSSASMGMGVMCPVSTSALRINYYNMSGAIGSHIPNGVTFRITFKVPIVGWSANIIPIQSQTIRLCEAYGGNLTRVTSTPTQLGQYRSMRRTTPSSATRTDEAPSSPPAAANGFLVSGGEAWAAAMASGLCDFYQFFVGKNKRVTLEGYSSTGRTGAITWDNILDGAYLLGTAFSYDPTSGVATVAKRLSGAATNGMYAAGDLSGFGNVASAYFDLVISDPQCVAEQAPVVYARYSTAAGQVIPTSTATIVNFGTKEVDTHGAVTPGASWAFVAPASGFYLVAATVLTGNYTWSQLTFIDLHLFVDGATRGYFARATILSTVNDYGFVTGASQVYLAAGQSLSIRVAQYSGASRALHTDTMWNHVSIAKVG